MKQDRLWVHPKFKKKMKKEALKRNMSVLRFTEEIAKEGCVLDKILKQKNEKNKKLFRFKI